MSTDHRDPDETCPGTPGVLTDGADGAGGDLERRLGRGAGQVWLAAQRSPLAQRRGRLGGESLAHPARMLPDLATTIIDTYSRPGELVLDPMCGIGTTLVSAVRLGRRAVGIELEPRWVRLAEENLQLARDDGFPAPAHVLRGDARTTHTLLTEHHSDNDHTAHTDPAHDGGEAGDERSVSLIVTSPPYGAGVHGQVTNRTPGGRIVKYDHRYATTSAGKPGNLADSPGELAASMTAILRSAAGVLRPGGHVAIVTRPWRHGGTLIDLSGEMIDCAHAAGLEPVDRAVSLLARLHDPLPPTATDTATGAEGADPAGDGGAARLVVRSSFFARHNLLRARAAGQPVHLIAHEDVSVFTLPTTAPR